MAENQPQPNNRAIADIFSRIADLIELDGGDHFKVKAYRRAADTLENLPDDIKNYYRNGVLSRVPGLGPALAKKVEEYLRTGRIHKLEDIEAAMPKPLVALLELPGITPRVLYRLRKELGVSSLDDLRKAVESGALENLKGLAKERKREIADSVRGR